MNENNVVARKEYEEFQRRVEDEHKRMNKRVETIEDTVRQIGVLTTSVEKMALSLESMVREQEKQGKRLDAIESRDGEKWRKLIWQVVTALVAAGIGFFAARIGLGG